MNLTNEKTKYFLYARKSTEGEDRQVQSIEDQIKYLKELAAKQGILIAQIFTEKKSAKKPYNRPVFAEMIQRIEKGEAKGILCWKLDRLARNPVDGGAITWMLQNSVIEQIKASDRSFYPTDNVLLMSIEFGMANQYIIDLRRNCRRGMLSRADKGWLPTLPPAGYLNDKENATIAIDEKRFPLIRKMWDLMLTGNYTPQQIRHIANKEWGYRTRQFKRQGGTEIANCTMYKLFTNIFYTGMFEWGGKLYNGKHTPMITVGEYDHVQAILGRLGRPRPKTHDFAYTGMISCGECGCMITATEKQKLVKKNNKLETYIYYHCTKKKKGAACSQRPVRLEELEKQIASVVDTYTISEGLLTAALKELNNKRKEKVEQICSVIQMREQSLSKTEKQLETLTRMRYSELIDDEGFIKERDSLQDVITRLKQELAETVDYSQRWIELTEKTFQFAAYAKEVFEKGTTKEKKEVLSGLGSNFLLKDKILNIEATEWMKALQKNYQPLMAEFARLELTLSPYYTGHDAEIQPFILRLRSTVEDVRTVFEKLNDPDIHIPHIGQTDSDELQHLDSEEP